jgi:TonB family protein
MSHRSGTVSRRDFAVWTECLVEGDQQLQRLQRHLRRRALLLSVASQTLVLAAIALLPLLGNPALVAPAIVTPLPPYHSRPAQSDVRHNVIPPKSSCRFCPGWKIPQNIVPSDPPRPQDGPSVPRFDGIDIPGTGAAPPDFTSLAPPPIPGPEVQRPTIVHITHISPAMLTHRVEPAYPILARQTGRSGRVELRAIIAADGTIQSLEAVGGDPVFYPSALDAVRQWRYTPTVLNNQKVQVDTYITVIYNIQR